jgi:hypothetical protein
MVASPQPTVEPPFDLTLRQQRLFDVCARITPGDWDAFSKAIRAANRATDADLAVVTKALNTVMPNGPKP